MNASRIALPVLAALCSIVSAPSELRAQGAASAGFTVTDDTSVRLIGRDGLAAFRHVTTFADVTILRSGPRVVVRDNNGVQILDRLGQPRGARIARLGVAQCVILDEGRVVVVDDDRVRIFDRDGAMLGAPILKTGNRRQQVKIVCGRVIVIDDDRVRIFDKDGTALGAPILRTGTSTQQVQVTDSRIIVIDDDRVRIFDKNGASVGAPILRTGTQRQRVEVDGDRIIVTDDDRVRIFDQDGGARGAPITKTGTARQNVIVCGSRIIIIDDDRVRVFDRDGGAIGAPVTGSGSGSGRQTVKTTGNRIIITDATRVQIFDKNMNHLTTVGRTGLDRQSVLVDGDRIIIIDEDRVRLFDENGASLGAPILRSGTETQRVRVDGDRILVTDTDQVRVFDRSGAPVGAPIPVSYVEEYDVLLFATGFTIVDNFSTVSIYDRDAIQQGQPVTVGLGVQHVQHSDGHYCIADDNRVRIYDSLGQQLGSTTTTVGEPWIQPVEYTAGDIQHFGLGCGGASHQAFGQPTIGGQVSFQFFGPANAPVSLGIGFTALPAPIDLASAGAPGCWLYTNVVGVVGTSTGIEGFATVTMSIAAEHALVGVHAQAQFFAVSPGANNLNVVTSNASWVIIGEGI